MWDGITYSHSDQIISLFNILINHIGELKNKIVTIILLTAYLLKIQIHGT